MNPPFEFTFDWLKHRTIFWKVHLKELTGKPNLRFLEVGSFEGRSALWMLANVLTHPTARIDCIDGFYKTSDEYEKRFDHNIYVSGFSEKVNKLRGDSNKILRELSFNSYDCIYLDGGHTAVEVIQDAVLSFSLLKKDGILIFDDYYWGNEKDPLLTPHKAINAFLDIYMNQYVLLQKNYQVIIRKV